MPNSQEVKRKQYSKRWDTIKFISLTEMSEKLEADPSLKAETQIITSAIKKIHRTIEDESS